MMEGTVLGVENLRTSFAIDAGSVRSIRGVTFHVGKGGSLGIMGEPGCERGMTMLSIMGLLEDDASRRAGALPFDGEDLLKKSSREMRKMQSSRIGMILQDPIISLNSLPTVGEQTRGPPMCHQKPSRKEAEKKTLAMLEATSLPSPRRRLKQCPREFSDGIHQRAMIATAMYCKPGLLVADKPTTAPDATIQIQILELVAHMEGEFSASVILITHDLGVVSSLCTRAIIIYGGLIIEEGKVEDIFYRTGHSYTAGLLASASKRTKEKLASIFNMSPDLLNPPKEYPFATRCFQAMKLCTVRQPPFCDLGNGHAGACWLHNESVRTRIGKMKLRRLNVLIPITVLK